MYNILPPTTAIISYAIALRKLSYFCLQFFVGIQIVVSEYLYICRCISGIRFQARSKEQEILEEGGGAGPSS